MRYFIMIGLDFQDLYPLTIISITKDEQEVIVVLKYDTTWHRELTTKCKNKETK